MKAEIVPGRFSHSGQVGGVQPNEGFYSMARASVNFVSHFIFCLGLQEEPKTAYPMSIIWASHNADSMLLE